MLSPQPPNLSCVTATYNLLIHMMRQLLLLGCVVSALDDTEAVQSAHCLRHETLAEKWQELRDKLFMTGTSISSMPHEAVCYVCQQDAAIRCHDCARDTFHCQLCGMSMHGDFNQYHYPERCTVSCTVMSIKTVVPSFLLIHIALFRVKILSRFVLRKSPKETTSCLVPYHILPISGGSGL